MSDLHIETRQEPTFMQNSPISHKQSISIQSPSSSSSIMADLDHHTHTHSNNSFKHRSSPSSSSAERLSKKHSFNQEDLSLVRLKRMKERLTEMKQWWDEVMKEEVEDEKEQEEQEEEPYLVVEDDKALSQDEMGQDYEEAISVEWVDKCLNLTFRCLCGKGYEVLISGNNCYYKVV